MFHNADTATAAEVRDIVRQYGFRFPVAIDRGVRTHKLWCREQDDWATSVTFLLDRDGVIRQIHSGGRYVKGDADYVALESGIERLLRQQPGAGSDR